MSDVPAAAAFENLASLSADQRNDLKSAVAQQTATLTVDAFAREVAQRAGVSAAKVSTILVSIAFLAVRHDTADGDLHQHLLDFMGQTFWPEGKSQDDLPDALSLLSSILKSSEFAVTAKAQSVLWDRGAAYQSSKTVTQIRPLFLSTVSESTKNAVIIHELQLGIKESDKVRHIEVLMDADQINKLISTLNRALEKEKSLRNDSKFNILSESQGADLL